MADTTWNDAKVLDSFPAAEGMRSLSVEVPKEVSAGFTVPGQFVQITDKSEEQKPNFFAIASPPPPKGRKGLLEFLIKETDSIQWLTSAPLGTPIKVSNVMGKGFSITDEFDSYKYDSPVLDIAFFACGSGIAPIRSVIESDVLRLASQEEPDLLARTATLFYGCRSEDTMAYKERFSEWEKMGVEVRPVYSRAAQKEYVQQDLSREGVARPRNTGVLLCGQKGMCDDVTKQLAKVGVYDSRMLTNF